MGNTYPKGLPDYINRNHVGMIIVFCFNISERNELNGIDRFNPFAR